MNFAQPYQPPRQAQLGIPSEFTEPAVKIWLSELPVADPDRAADILLYGLRVLGRTAGLSIRARLSQLDGIAATIDQIIGDDPAGTPAQDDAVFPLRDLQERRAHRSYTLYADLADAYREVSLDAENWERLAAISGLRTQVLHRALNIASKAYLRLLENYQLTPPSFWRNVYDLYQEAVKHRLDLDTVDGIEKCATVFCEFMRIVLFALANVSRFRPREIRQIYEVLGELAEKAELCDIPVRDDQKAQFFLDMAVDAPPQTILSLRGEGPVERRFVMTQLLVKWASKYYADANNRRIGGGRVSKTLLSTVLKNLTIPERRKSKRFLDTGEHRICLGIGAIANSLMHGSRDDALMGLARADADNDGEWLKVPNYTVEVIEDDPRRIRGEERMARDDRQLGWQFGHSDPAQDSEIIEPDWHRDHSYDGNGRSAPRVDVWLLNSSAQGFCLLWTDKSISGARVGELVGVESDGTGLYLGVIRWLSHNNVGNLLIGLELVSPKVEAGEIWPHHRPTENHRALYVPPDSKLSRPAMVFASPTGFDAGLIIEWAGDGLPRILKLDRIEINTPAFVAYAVSAAPRDALTVPH